MSCIRGVAPSRGWQTRTDEDDDQKNVLHTLARWWYCPFFVPHTAYTHSLVGFVARRITSSSYSWGTTTTARSQPRLRLSQWIVLLLAWYNVEPTQWIRSFAQCCSSKVRSSTGRVTGWMDGWVGRRVCEWVGFVGWKEIYKSILLFMDSIWVAFIMCVGVHVPMYVVWVEFETVGKNSKHPRSHCTSFSSHHDGAAAAAAEAESGRGVNKNADQSRNLQFMDRMNGY